MLSAKTSLSPLSNPKKKKNKKGGGKEENGGKNNGMKQQKVKSAGEEKGKTTMKKANGEKGANNSKKAEENGQKNNGNGDGNKQKQMEKQKKQQQQEKVPPPTTTRKRKATVKVTTTNGQQEEAGKWKRMRAQIQAEAAEGNNAANSQTTTTTTKVLGIDCEYVGIGLDGTDNMLARVSIVNEQGKPIYDKYVRPCEEVVDYRTAVSGIRPGHLTRGLPFTQVQSEVKKLMADNIIVGHSVHNDFKVLGLAHPARLVRDTAKFKPLRLTLTEQQRTPSLKMLAHALLGVQIQQGEHCSVLDARIALRIYQMHRQQWERAVKTKKNNKNKGNKKK